MIIPIYILTILGQVYIMVNDPSITKIIFGSIIIVGTTISVFMYYRSIPKDVNGYVLSLIFLGQRKFAFFMHPMAYYRLNNRKVAMIPEKLSTIIDQNKYPLKVYYDSRYHVFIHDGHAAAFAILYPSLLEYIKLVSEIGVDMK